MRKYEKQCLWRKGSSEEDDIVVDMAVDTFFEGGASNGGEVSLRDCGP